MWLNNNKGVSVSGWQDSSNSTTDHTISQATEGDQAALRSGGLLFVSSEADHYDMANQIAISLQEGFTIMCVVNLTAHNANQVLLGLNNTNHFFQFNAGGDTLALKLGTTTTTITPGDDSSFDAGSTFMLTVKRDSGATGNIHLYKNGTLLSQDEQAANTGDAEFITVGTRNADRYFNGSLYELAIWERDLDEHELNDIHHCVKKRFSL
jgi:hypothetical protein